MEVLVNLGGITTCLSVKEFIYFFKSISDKNFV